MSKIRVKDLRELLRYDPGTGNLLWLISRRRIRLGMVAGYLDTDGYVHVTIDRRKYFAHRLIWMLLHGRWPDGELDHKNLIKSDNRLDNLREASHGQNMANKAVRKDSLSGVKGVRFVKKLQRWRAEIKIAGRTRCLGLFDDQDSAHTAFSAAVRERHGEFARPQ